MDFVAKNQGIDCEKEILNYLHVLWNVCFNSSSFYVRHCSWTFFPFTKVFKTLQSTYRKVHKMEIFHLMNSYKSNILVIATQVNFAFSCPCTPQECNIFYQ